MALPQGYADSRIVARRASPPMTIPTTVIFDLDDPLIWAYANRDVAWCDHLAGYAAAIRPHNPVKVPDTTSSRAARFWKNPNVYGGGGHDLKDARRAIVGGAFAQLTIAVPSLASEIADAFTAKKTGQRTLPRHDPGPFRTQEQRICTGPTNQWWSRQPTRKTRTLCPIRLFPIYRYLRGNWVRQARSRHFRTGPHSARRHGA